MLSVTESEAVPFTRLGANMSEQIVRGAEFVRGLEGPSACVVCLSCLNNGRALGVWVSIDKAAEETAADEITYNGQGSAAQYPNGGTYTACNRCGGDEWDLVDHEYLPPSMRTVRAFYESAGTLAEYEDIDALLAFASWFDVGGYLPIDELITEHEDRYQSQYSSFEGFAEQYADSVGDLAAIPEHLQHYIDWEAYARDLSHDFYYESGHVWRSN